jgi:hypothetical protein
MVKQDIWVNVDRLQSVNFRPLLSQTLAGDLIEISCQNLTQPFSSVGVTSTKSHNKLHITMILNTPAPTTSRKKAVNTPMTRKRRRELEAGNDSSSPDSIEVETPIRAVKWAKRSSRLTPVQTPPGKGKARVEQRDADSDEEGKRASPSKPLVHRAVRAARKAGNLFIPEYEGMPKRDPPVCYRF